MTKNFLEREQRRAMKLVLRGDLTFEQAELILTCLIIEKVQQGLITPTQASDMLKQIQ